jgi:hypothetical protein
MFSRLEILNLSVGGDCILRKLLRLEQVGFEFQPDAAIFSVAAVERQFVVQHLRKALTLEIDPPAEYREFLSQIMTKAGVHGKMPDVMIERRLAPYVPEIYQWVFHRLKEQCARRGVRPLVIYRPAPVDFEGNEEAGQKELIHHAQAEKLEIIDLSAAFDSVVDRNTLILAKWDHHTTALGHRLLAGELYDGLVPWLSARRGTKPVDP